MKGTTSRQERREERRERENRESERAHTRIYTHTLDGQALLVKGKEGKKGKRRGVNCSLMISDVTERKRERESQAHASGCVRMCHEKRETKKQGKEIEREPESR